MCAISAAVNKMAFGAREPSSLPSPASVRADERHVCADHLWQLAARSVSARPEEMTHPLGQQSIARRTARHVTAPRRRITPRPPVACKERRANAIPRRAP